MLDVFNPLSFIDPTGYEVEEILVVGQSTSGNNGTDYMDWRVFSFSGGGSGFSGYHSDLGNLQEAILNGVNEVSFVGADGSTRHYNVSIAEGRKELLLALTAKGLNNIFIKNGYGVGLGGRPGVGGAQEKDYSVGARDFFELLGQSFMENVNAGSRLGAAFGVGAAVAADHQLNLRNSDVSIEKISGAELEWGLGISGTPFSSEKIQGFYQGVEFKLWGGVKVIWDYQGNWAVSTSLVFPVSKGGGVVSGYKTTGRDIADSLGGN